MNGDTDRPDIIDEAPLDLIITDDFIKRLEIAAELYQKRYLPLAIKLTNEGDWIKHESRGIARYSLQASGAEKLANPFGIVWDRPVVAKHARADAEGTFYEYEVEGIMKSGALKRWGWFTGNCSSRDVFFNARGRYDEGDIRKAAFSNFLVNGIARLIGIRNPTPTMLQGAGLDVTKITAPDYSGQGSRRAEQSHDAISEAQAKRFWAISRGKGWTQEQIRVLLEGFEIKSTNDIPRSKYEALCKIVDEPVPAEINAEAQNRESWAKKEATA